MCVVLCVGGSEIGSMIELKISNFWPTSDQKKIKKKKRKKSKRKNKKKKTKIKNIIKCQNKIINFYDIITSIFHSIIFHFLNL